MARAGRGEGGGQAKGPKPRAKTIFRRTWDVVEVNCNSVIVDYVYGSPNKGGTHRTGRNSKVEAGGEGSWFGSDKESIYSMCTSSV